MADKRVDNQNAGKFSIENTIEVGDTKLLDELRSPETSTDPDEITDIDDTPEEKQEGATEKTITDFLYSEEEEEEEEEEEQVEKEIGKETGNDDDEEIEEDDETEGEVSQFKALSNDLFKLGVFKLDEGEEEPDINTPEDFLKRFNEEKKKGASAIIDNFIGQFGEDYQRAFDAIYVKGANPKEFFSTYNEVVDFADLDMKDEKNQEIIVRAMLSEQGLTPEDVDEEINQLREYGDLEKKATKFHPVLVKRKAQKLKDIEDEAERAQQQKVALRNEYIHNVQAVLREKMENKEFDGIPINANIANELQDFLLVDKYRTASGETLTDFDRTILELKRPENHEKKVKVALILKMLEKDPTLSTIQKSGISKTSSKLFEEVARQKTKAVPSVKSQGTIKRNTWSKL